jgi:predicted Fe-S protein YdhL (DUF1289 family)
MGCGRHIDEIAQWPNFSDEQRQTILDRLRDRFADPTPAITSPAISADGPDQPASGPSACGIEAAGVTMAAASRTTSSPAPDLTA